MLNKFHKKEIENPIYQLLYPEQADLLMHRDMPINAKICQ